MAKLSDIHPANSPVNLLDAEGLKEYLRQWHNGRSIIRYRPTGVTFSAPLLVKRVAPLDMDNTYDDFYERRKG